MNVELHRFMELGMPSHARYLREGDMHIGDLVLEFPNPDHEEVIAQMGEEAVEASVLPEIFSQAFELFDGSINKELQEYNVL
jgi:hypothetical protein